MLKMLEPQERQQLQDALISAFPGLSELKRLSSYGLNQNLEKIANCNETLSETVFDFIAWAVANEEIEKLISAACNSNRTNLDLKTFVEKVWLPSQPQQELVVPLQQQTETQTPVEVEAPIEKPD